MNQPTPLLILSDSPTAKTGLGRIARDIATRIHKYLPDVFRVGTIGYGGPFSSTLGFMQYPLDMQDWVVFNLPEVWTDFSQGQKGAVLSIWDASRMQWLARPEMCHNRRLRDFLNTKPFKTYGYWPVDATGVNDRLTQVLSHTMEGYDRSLAYSKWAEDIMRRSMKKTEGLANLPHGIDTSVFYPRNRIQARHGFGQKTGARYVQGKRNGQFISIPDDVLLIGVVGTNQIRKDWGLALRVIAELAKERKVMAWLHTDVLDRHWSFANLSYDFDIRDQLIVDIAEPSDEQMGWVYSACDITLGIGLGEGFGFPIFESLACGTPCIHGNYGGAPEHMPSEMLVEPVAYRLEGQFNCVRPVFEPHDWVDAVRRVVLQYKGNNKSLLPEHLDWNNLWSRWSQWLLQGVECNRNLTSQESVSVPSESCR